MLMDCIDRIAMLLTQGGGLWAAGVSGVYVNAVVPFHRVLAISRPLAQLTRGIIGIKEWDRVTLASHSHSSNGASHRGSCDCLHLGAMCACVRHSHVRVCVRDGVFVSGMPVLFADLRGERERGSHINTFLQGQPMKDRLFCETPRALFGIESNSRTTRDLKNCAKAHLAAC